MQHALILASVASMIRHFNMPNIHLLQERGYTVHVACNFVEGSSCNEAGIEELKKTLSDMGVLMHHIDFSRNMFDMKSNFKAFKQLKAIFAETAFSLMHCHTPIASVLGRLAAKKYRKNGLKVIYTAHGFHFYKGAPLKNKIVFYPIERFCSRFTDILITINQEDYALAKAKMKSKRVEYIPGIGIDTQLISGIGVTKAQKRNELSIPEDSKLLLSVGELNQNKNHETVIKAISELNDKTVHYAIAGVGVLRDKLDTFIKECGLEGRVHLLGYRTDVKELYKAADIFVHPSFREGLSVAVMEAMASGLPVVASNIRGNCDLIDEAWLVSPNDIGGFAKKINELLENADLCANVGKDNKEKSKKYDIDVIVEAMKSIY